MSVVGSRERDNKMKKDEVGMGESDKKRKDSV